MNWLWEDDDEEPTDEELAEIEWERKVFPDGFCKACGAPLDELSNYSECPNCGERDWL